jgi:AcrR family transcriptional regulator
MSTAAVQPITGKGQATRGRLLEAARQRAIASGGHFEIADVARDAGVVPALVHRYFGSKSGLVAALVDDYFDRFHTEVLDLDLDDRGDWAHHERLRLEAGVRFHYRQPFSVVVYGALARDPEVARREAERTAAVVDRAARSIRKGQKAGELPADVDPGLAGAAMFGAMRLVLVEALSRKKRPPAERVIDVLWWQVAASVHIDPVKSIARKE